MSPKVFKIRHALAENRYAPATRLAGSRGACMSRGAGLRQMRCLRSAHLNTRSPVGQPDAFASALPLFSDLFNKARDVAWPGIAFFSLIKDPKRTRHV